MRKSRATNYEDGHIVKQYGIYPLIHQVVGKPELLKFIGNVKEQKILDFGCGNGHITFALHRRGANCIGVDPSKKFIAEAQAKYPALDFRLIPRSKLQGLKTGAFDKVISCLVLPSLDGKRDFQMLFRESARVLKVGGELIISALHPLMVRNMQDKIRKVRMPNTMNYFSSGEKFENDLMVTEDTYMTFINSQWTLEDISKELSANNFTITAIKEPKMSKNKHWDLLEDSLRTPYHIFFKATKLKARL